MAKKEYPRVTYNRVSDFSFPITETHETGAWEDETVWISLTKLKLMVAEMEREGFKIVEVSPDFNYSCGESQLVDIDFQMVDAQWETKEEIEKRVAEQEARKKVEEKKHLLHQKAEIEKKLKELE